jgi:hypothetical protein
MAGEIIYYAGGSVYLFPLNSYILQIQKGINQIKEGEVVKLREAKSFQYFCQTRKPQKKKVYIYRQPTHRFTNILIGSVINLLVISRISWGSVAEMRHTCVAGGRYLYTS